MTYLQPNFSEKEMVLQQGKRSISPSQPPPYFVHQPPPPPPPPPSSSGVQTGGFNLNSKVSPSVLLIIIILAIIFFVSGLLHLLVRYLLRPPRRDPDEIDTVTALQGQLQQLFHLHDAGVDQSFIDTLPIFNYKAIIGVKSPFDCAVCLSEFEAEDKLRLLPKCSHAFHMECIDTWLLSHSTCPLCRASLIPDFSSNRHCSPIVLVLESGSESSREIIPDREGGLGNTNSVARVSSHLSTSRCEDESRLPNSGLLLQKSCEIQVKEDDNQQQQQNIVVGSGEKVLPVKLGKFRNVDGGGGAGGEGSSTTNNVDSRRCFSMGSFAYIMDENSALQVPIRTPIKKQSSKKPALPLNPGHRYAMSECGGGDSRRDFANFEAFRNGEFLQCSNNSGGIAYSGNLCSNVNDSNKSIGSSRGESFSFSKIWLRGKKDKAHNHITDTEQPPSRRAFSFRFPMQQHNVIAEEDDVKHNKKIINGGRRTISEIDIGRWANGGIENSSELDAQSLNSLDSQSNHPSFARKTLLWLMGRQQNKVVHSQFSSQLV
ncbi:OLC1v1035337C1 [Oldenlandia corymbosa var. corymbosa]|uniref:RING-type E3 ubiquitin transferase n=1 Tax=Oldenlandia corymbosa var. corymbosa TaxID=529605 RepID=A0AAV1CW29_OLDCO|nr:OLC1v1035337C1 [Oldenlandia corymbosa var. corymbosa]